MRVFVEETHSFTSTSKGKRTHCTESLYAELYLFTFVMRFIFNKDRKSPLLALGSEVNFIICGLETAIRLSCEATANAFLANIPHRFGKSIFRHASLWGSKSSSLNSAVHKSTVFRTKTTELIQPLLNIFFLHCPTTSSHVCMMNSKEQFSCVNFVQMKLHWNFHVMKSEK